MSPLAYDADAAHCRGRRAGVPAGGEGLTTRGEPHPRDRQPGCDDLRRHDPGIRPTEGVAALADLGARADALPVEPMAGPGDTDRLRCWAALDRGAEESHRCAG